MNKLLDAFAASLSFTVVFAGFHFLDTLHGFEIYVGLMVISAMMANGIIQLRKFWKD